MQTVTISQIRKWSFSFSYTLHSVLCMLCCRSAGLDSSCTCRHSAVLSRHLDRLSQCYPSYRTIGKALKMSQNTVRKYVQSIEDKHLISTERTEVITKDGRKRNGTLLYTIHPIREAIDYFHNEQLRRNA